VRNLLEDFLLKDYCSCFFGYSDDLARDLLEWRRIQLKECRLFIIKTSLGFLAPTR